jgi:hypothetical protein
MKTNGTYSLEMNIPLENEITDLGTDQKGKVRSEQVAARLNIFFL